MKHPALTFILCILAFCSAQAQRITHDFRDVSMSEALRFIQMQTQQYDIVFIYNELENFRVTTQLHNTTVPDAIAQIAGFYPVRVYRNGEREIYVECTHKTDRHLTGSIVDEQGRPVAYANVAVMSPADSVLLGAGVSNEGGFFAVPYDTPPDDGVGQADGVAVRITYVGYRTVSRLCRQNNMGTVRMLTETQRLEGITIEGQAPVVRREHGTVIFDTRRTAGAANAWELLRFAPGTLPKGTWE